MSPCIIQRQLGAANLGTTSIYLQGIDTDEINRHRARLTSGITRLLDIRSKRKPDRPIFASCSALRPRAQTPRQRLAARGL